MTPTEIVQRLLESLALHYRNPLDEAHKPCAESALHDLQMALQRGGEPPAVTHSGWYGDVCLFGIGKN